MKCLLATLTAVFLTITIAQTGLTYPTQLLPVDENDLTSIGTGSFTIKSGYGSFYNFDVTDVTTDLVMIKMTATSGSDGGLGAIQIFDGATQNLIPYAASSHQDWGRAQSSDTWYSTGIIDPLSSMTSYSIHRAAYNGNNNYAGAINNNFTYHRDGTNIMYYYVAFDAPVNITDIKLGSGTNRGVIYNVEFLAGNISESAVPEPLSVSLVLMGSGAILWRRKS